MILILGLCLVLGSATFFFVSYYTDYQKQLDEFNRGVLTLPFTNQTPESNPTNRTPDAQPLSSGGITSRRGGGGGGGGGGGPGPDPGPSDPPSPPSTNSPEILMVSHPSPVEDASSAVIEFIPFVLSPATFQSCRLYGDYASDATTVQATLAPTNGVVNSLSASLPSEGVYSWKVICTTTAGVEVASDTSSFVVNRQAPSVSIVSPAGESFVGPRDIPLVASVTGISKEEIASWEYAVYGLDPSFTVIVPFQSLGVPLDTSVNTMVRIPRVLDSSSYILSLKAISTSGLEHVVNATFTLSFPPLAPEPRFAVSTWPLTPGASITFNARHSTDPSGGTIVSYEWEMGDGTIRSGDYITHSYPLGVERGYLVNLTVTNDAGLRTTLLQNLTVANWISVHNADSLYAIRDNLKGYYIQVNAIDLSSASFGDWDPIGNAARIGGYADPLSPEEYLPFTGYYDGQGFPIHNLRVVSADHYYAPGNDLAMGGLFRFNAGVLENIVLQNASVEGQGGLGLLTGVNLPGGALIGGSVEGVIILNASADTTVNGHNGYAESIGGIAGINFGTINSSSSTITIRTDPAEQSIGSASVRGVRSVGGLVGKNYHIIEDSSADLYLNESLGGSDVGGLVGSLRYSPESITRNFTYLSSSLYSPYERLLFSQRGDELFVYTPSIIASLAQGTLVLASAEHVGGLVGGAYDRFVVENTQSFTSVAIPNGSAVGGFAGFIMADNGESRFSSVSSFGSVVGSQSAGGFVGEMSGGKGELLMSDLESTGSVRGACYVGGFAGSLIVHTDRQMIDNARSSGAVEGGRWVGGFAGRIENGALGEDIPGVSSGGRIQQSYTFSDVNGKEGVGGFAGGVYSSGLRLTIAESFAHNLVTQNASLDVPSCTTTISGTPHASGGFSSTIGGNVLIDQSFARTDLLADSARYTAGFAGMVFKGASIRESYADGPVTMAGGSTSGFTVALVNSALSHVYSAVTLTQSGTSLLKGGLVGLTFGTVSADASYWDSDRAGVSTGTLGIGLTTVLMQQMSSYTGWDFSTIWTLLAGESPRLLWELDVCGPVGCSPPLGVEPKLFSLPLIIILAVHALLLLLLIVRIVHVSHHASFDDVPQPPVFSAPPSLPPYTPPALPSSPRPALLIR